jgi:hypothetical protein
VGSSVQPEIKFATKITGKFIRKKMQDALNCPVGNLSVLALNSVTPALWGKIMYAVLLSLTDHNSGMSYSIAAAF